MSTTIINNPNDLHDEHQDDAVQMTATDTAVTSAVDNPISPVELPDTVGRWIKRFITGMLIGVGAILPGVSGGAFCAAFGIYRPMMDFFAHPAKNFKKNLRFFIPVGLGAAIGFIALAGLVSWLLSLAGIGVMVIAFFIGCIGGTLPALFKEANGPKWKVYHYLILAASLGLTIWGLLSMSKVESMKQLLADPSSLTYLITWLVCGIIFALGSIVPGMSPSSIIMYAELYQPMTEGISKFNMSILLPFVLGVVLCIVLFSKLISWLFDRAGSSMFSFIIGVVIGSTILVAHSQVYVPLAAAFSLAQLIGVAVCAVVGFLVVVLLAKLDPR